MIRCCSKFFNPLPSNIGGQVFLSRIYVASRSSDFNQKRYTSGENQPPKRFRKIFYTTVGLTLIGVGGVVVYAKSDPKFRKVLDSYVPGSDKFIRIVYQEDGSFNVGFAELQDKVLSIPSDIYKQISGTSSEASSSVLPKTKELKSEESTKPKPKPAVDTSRKGITVYQVSATDLKAIGDEASAIYNELIESMKGKAEEIIEAIDKLDDSPDPDKAWKEVRGKMEEQKKFSEEVDNKFKEADEKVKQFASLKKKTPDIGEDIKLSESEMMKLKEKAEDLRYNKLEASSKYLAKVEEALNRSSDELKTLFPGFRPGSRRIKLTEDDLDLFLYYAFHKLTYYQKELEKMDNVIKQKLDKAVKNKDDYKAIQAGVEAKFEEEKRKIKEDYDKKMLELKKDCDEGVHDSLKRQEQVHLDILNEQLALKEKEVERKLLQKMEEKLVDEQARLQTELADMTGRMQGLNEAIAKRALQDQKAQTSQALWSAAQALHDSLLHGDGEEVKPLEENIEAIKNSSAKGDDLVETVLATIPSVAVERGVYPKDSLRERFLKVEETAWKVAGVPEGGASLPMLLVAWLQSLLVIKASEPIPSSELNNEPFDPSSLNNYEILQRARYYIDRGDFEQALKYMNLLKGGARAVSSEWIKEAIILLETEQAAHLLLAHASASGMIYS